MIDWNLWQTLVFGILTAELLKNLWDRFIGEIRFT